MAEGKSPWARMDAVVVLLAFAMVALLAWWLAPGKAPALSSPGVMTTLIDNRLLIGVLRATGVIVLIYATISVALLLKDKVLITKAGGMEASRIVQETAAVLDDKDEKIASLATEVEQLRQRLGESAQRSPEVLKDVQKDMQKETERVVLQLNRMLGISDPKWRQLQSTRDAWAKHLESSTVQDDPFIKWYLGEHRRARDKEAGES